MKVTIKLDKRVGKKSGEFPIKFFVTNKSESFFIPSGYSVQARYWNENTSLLRSNAVNSAEINSYLSDRLNAMRQAMRDLDEDISIEELKTILLNVDKIPVSHNLADVWSEFVSNKKGKTRQTYDYAWQKIVGYAPLLSWKDLNYGWLISFQKFLTDAGLGIDSRGIILRCLRAVNNYALRCEYTTAYPFRSFQIATAPAASRRKNELTLTVAEIKKLWSADVDDSLRWARDVWFVSFFLGGVNLIDLYKIAAPDENKKVSYIRTKIERFQPEAVELDLSGLPTFLTDSLLSGIKGKMIDDLGKDWDRFSDYHKKNLQRLSVATGIKVNMYAARYSWATIAASVGVPVEVIDRIQGHVGSSSLAEKYYIKFDWSRVRDALGIVARMIVDE